MEASGELRVGGVTLALPRTDGDGTAEKTGVCSSKNYFKSNCSIKNSLEKSQMTSIIAVLEHAKNKRSSINRN